MMCQCVCDTAVTFLEIGLHKERINFSVSPRFISYRILPTFLIVRISFKSILHCRLAKK